MSISQTQAQVIPAGPPERLRSRRGLALPLALGISLTVLVLLPILLMFLGAMRTGTFVDPRAEFSLRSLQTVYTTLPYLKTLAVTIGASLLVSLIACLVGIALAPAAVADRHPGARLHGRQCVIAPLYLSPFVGALAWLILGLAERGLAQCYGSRPPRHPGRRDQYRQRHGRHSDQWPSTMLPYAYADGLSALKGMGSLDGRRPI